MTKNEDPWGIQVGQAAWAKVVKPAPGRLRIVQAFVNTFDVKTGNEELTKPRALAEWLVRWELLDPETRLRKAELKRAVKVRNALRELVGVTRGGRLEDSTIELLDEAAAGSLLRLRFGAGGLVYTELANEGFERALSELFQIVAAAQDAGTWIRLKPCTFEDCRRVLYDGSPNRHGRWCSMQACGNLNKSRSHTRRQRRKGR